MSHPKLTSFGNSCHCPHLAGNSGELLQSPGVASESVEVFPTEAMTGLKFEGAA